MTGRTDEGQSRRIRRPLLSVSKITKAGNQVYLGEDKAFVKNNKTGQITNLRRECNVWMLDLWVKRPADAMQSWAAEDTRRHDCDDGGTVPVPLLAPVNEDSAPMEDGESRG